MRGATIKANERPRTPRPHPKVVRPVVAGLLAALIAGTGGSAVGQTLDQALAAAYKNNPTLQASRARLRAIDEGVPQALSGWRPKLTAEADVGRSFNKTSSPFFAAEQKRNPENYRLQFEQPLYRGGRTVAGTRLAENRVASGRAELLGTEQDVLSAAVTAYMDVLRDQAVLDLNVNNEQVLTRQLQATRDQFEVGEVTRTDVSQAEARLAGANADRIRAEATLESSRAFYRNVIGEPPGELTPPEPLEGLPGSVEEAVALSEQNPDVAAALFSEKAAVEAVDVVTGELLPTVSVTAEVVRNEDSFARGSLAKTKQIRAEVTVPLYQAGAVSSRVREARQTVLQRRGEIEAARRNSTEVATRSWETLGAARARVASFESQIRANEIALDGVRQEAMVGARTILDILDAEQELFSSQVNLVRAQRDEVVAAFELKAAIGQMTAEELGLPVQVYDPEANYEKVRNKFWGLGIDSTEGMGSEGETIR